MNDVATTLFFFIVLGLSPGVLLMDLWWKRRIRSWRADTLRKIEESRVRSEEYARDPKPRLPGTHLFADEVDHERGLHGQVQGFENLLRYYGGMPKESVAEGHCGSHRVPWPSNEEPPEPENRFFASLKLERGPLGESCVVFGKPQPHRDGCTCDTCWPDDPVLYSNDALDEAVKNGAVLREGPVAYQEPTPVIDFDAIRALRKNERAERLDGWRAKVSEGDRGASLYLDQSKKYVVVAEYTIGNSFPLGTILEVVSPAEGPPGRYWFLDPGPPRVALIMPQDCVELVDDLPGPPIDPGDAS